MPPPHHQQVPPQHRYPTYLSRHASDVFQSLTRFNTGKRSGVRDDALKPYIEAARWIPLAIHPFASISTFLYAGIADDENEDPTFEPEDVRMYNEAMKLVPSFQSTLSEFYQQPDQLQIFVSSLSSYASAARQEDTASLKYDILQYLMPDPTTQSVVPPITRADLKSARGFNHRVTARLLCPIAKISDFDKDPIGFMAEANDGTVRIRASEWPSFLYDDDATFDPEDEEVGLFKGYLLLRVYRHIFTGPSSALGGRRDATKPSKAQLHSLTATTGRTIAYAAVQARVALNSSERWGRYDFDFDHEAMYNNIVALFELDSNAPWVVETLAWWDEQVHLTPHGKKRGRHNLDPSSEDEDPVRRIFEQRAARRQREEEELETAARAQRRAQLLELARRGGYGQEEANELGGLHPDLFQDEEAAREALLREEEEREARLEEEREARLEEEREKRLEEERERRSEEPSRDEDGTRPEEEEDDAERREENTHPRASSSRQRSRSRPRPRPRPREHSMNPPLSSGSGTVSHDYYTRHRGRRNETLA